MANNVYANGREVSCKAAVFFGTNGLLLFSNRSRE